MSQDIVVGVILGTGATLLSLLVVVCVVAVYSAFRRLQQVQNKNQVAQNETIEAECTCNEQHSKCEQHDEKLLRQISKTISSTGDMIDLGLALNIKRKVIESCYEDYKGSINTAVLKMLHKWYDRQLDFKVNSEAVVKLKNALKDIGQEAHGTEIVDDHFETR